MQLHYDGARYDSTPEVDLDRPELSLEWAHAFGKRVTTLVAGRGALRLQGDDARSGWDGSVRALLRARVHERFGLRLGAAFLHREADDAAFTARVARGADLLGSPPCRRSPMPRIVDGSRRSTAASSPSSSATRCRRSRRRPVLRLDPGATVAWLPDGSVALAAYSELEGVALPGAAYRLLARFTGAEPVAEVRARLRAEEHADLADDVLLELYRQRVLSAPPALPAPGVRGREPAPE